MGVSQGADGEEAVELPLVMMNSISTSGLMHEQAKALSGVDSKLV